MTSKRPYFVLAALGASVAFACSPENPAPSLPSGASGSAGSSTGGAAASGSAGASVVPGMGGSAGNGLAPTAGTPGVGGAPVGTAGSAGSAGAATAGGGGAGGAGNGGSNPGNYPEPPRPINVQSTQKVDISFPGSAIDPPASGTHTGQFDPTAAAGVQKKLVLPLGGVNSGPMKMGWATARGFHMLAVPLWNNYPNDMYHREYLESWSGEDLSAQITQSPANSVMSRVKGSLAYLAQNDPGSDWGYFLDAQGEVRWNDVIVFGYSFGGQMGVAATKYVALDRVIITASPNVPIGAPWLTEMPNVTPVERCYQFVGYNEGEHDTHIDETTLLGWLGEPFDVGNGVDTPPPYPSNRLIVDDGHSDFCGRPFNDGMKDWDKICEWLFNVQ